MYGYTKISRQSQKFKDKVYFIGLAQDFVFCVKEKINPKKSFQIMQKE